MGLVDKLLAWAIFGFLALVMIMSLCMIIYYGQMIFSEIRYEKKTYAGHQREGDYNKRGVRCE